MEKFKLLLNGTDLSIFKGIFSNIPEDFSCVSSSSFWNDIKEHCSIFNPDAFIYVIEENDTHFKEIVKKLRTSAQYKELPIVLITTTDPNKILDSKTVDEIDYVIKRPISIEQLFLNIRRFIQVYRLDLEKRRLERAKEEKQRKLLERKTILVVDDDKNVLKLLKTTLEEYYDVITTFTGKIAEKYLENNTCDLIILDYQMPVENGPEVYAKIKAMDHAKDIPIIFLSGVADKEKIAEVMMLKPQGYLLKPIEIDKLLGTIEEVIYGNL